MVKTNLISYYCLHVICSFICVKSQAQSAQTSHKIVATETPTYFINAQGDTIPYGVHLPIMGTLVPTDSLQPPKNEGVKEIDQQSILAHPNEQTVGEPIKAKIYTTPATPEQLAYLKNFSGDTLKVPITVTPVKQPKAIPALGVGRKEAALENFSFIQETNGLPSATINDLHEDAYGNLWVATDNGLIRYDGVHFFHFTQAEGLTNPKLLEIMTGGKDNLWFITPNGIEKYDGKNFTFFNTSEILRSIHISEFIQLYTWSIDEKNGLDYLFTGKEGGIVSFDGTHFLKYPVVNGINVKSLKRSISGIDKQKQFWFGTTKGLLSFNGKTFTHYEFEVPFEHSVFSQLDSQGNLWNSLCCGYGGFYRLSKEAVTFFPIKFKKEGWSANRMLSSLEDKEGNLWFGSRHNGLFKLPANQKLATPATFIEYGPQEGMIDAPINSILENKEGIIWVGTYRGGLYKLSNLRFAHYTSKEGVIDGVTTDIIEAESGKLTFLLGNYGGPLFYDGKNFTGSIGFGATSATLIESEAGDLWTGHMGYGVTHLKNHQGKLIERHYLEKQQGIKGKKIYDILQDEQKNIWFTAIEFSAEDEAGLTYYNPKMGQFTHFTTDEGLINNSNYTLLVDKKENLWFGADGTISRMELDTTLAGIGGQIIHYPISNGTRKSQKIDAFLEDSQQRIWIGTDKGIVLYTPTSLQEVSTSTLNDQLKQFSFFTTADGLFHENVKSIIEDKKRNTWITTEKGITVLHPTQANTNKEGNIKMGNDTYQYFNFGKKDGIAER